MFHATEVCEDQKLKLAINLAFSCSLRIGEVLGLTWDCIDVSEEAIRTGYASLSVTKELQRVRKDSLAFMDQKDVLYVFPTSSKKATTVIVLKSPKTEGSKRKVFLPKTVANMLINWKMEQDYVKDTLGSEYTDYNLVLAGPTGFPMEQSTLTEAFNKLIEENGLPKVVFHSLRHSSITYKLKLNGGDIKAVQGDSGHSQTSMVTDVYSHIIDEDRRANAMLFEDMFYKKKEADPEGLQEGERTGLEGTEAELLGKILSNPEAMALLRALTKTL